jgi:hypothetical protein
LPTHPACPDPSLRGAFQVPISLNVTLAGGLPPGRFTAEGLPADLAIDPSTGVISGRLMEFGMFGYNVSVNGATAQCNLTGGHSMSNQPPNQQPHVPAVFWRHV